MKLIKEIRAADVGLEQTKPLDPDKYRKRNRASAIVQNKAGKIALLNISNYDYWQLPGGRVDDQENLMAALKREILEEAGTDIEIISEIGTIIEYEDHCGVLQTTRCFLTKTRGEPQKPSFTDEEIEEGLQLEWVTVDQAIDMLKNGQPKRNYGHFNMRRELEFIKEARKKFKI